MVASSNVVAATAGFPDAIVSLAVGLIGVALARWVFIGREARRLGTPQKWSDTIGLTLMAMLVTGVVIHDQQLGLSAAAFTGLGVGWVAVILLDLFGDRVLSIFRAGFAMDVPKEVKKADISGLDGVMVDETDLPPDMRAMLAELDKTETGHPDDRLRRLMQKLKDREGDPPKP